jgi:hypothetical protein
MKQTFLTVILLFTAVFSLLAQRPSEKGSLISYSEFGALVGNPDNQNDAPFIFHSSLNYAFHKNLSAGLGAGVEFLEETLLPVTANVLYQFGDKKIITPFVRLQGGYQIPLESKMAATRRYDYLASSAYYYYDHEKMVSKGGILVNPSVGFVFYTKPGLGISLAAGYRYQRLAYKQKDTDYKLLVEYNRLSLTLGIIF